MATDHFTKYKWQEDRVDWNLNILFNDQPQVAEYVAQYKDALQHPGLHKPVPSEWLHATVLRLGFLEEFTEAEMLELAARLEARFAELRMPEFLIGNWWIWGGNPCVHFTPDEPLREVFAVIVAELTGIVGVERLPKKLSFTPHITLAYSKTYNDEVGVLRQLEQVKVPAVPFKAKSVALIKQCITDDYYTWDIVKDIPLGQK